jgi:hypothetical protein
LSDSGKQPLARSFSIYRSHARRGIGEQPGGAVAAGEQYLEGDDEIKSDATLLDEIRPWMTLDVDPGHLRKIEGGLECWSSMVESGLLFVVRLVPAPPFDGRASYFAHGRAWKLEELPDDYDPGLLISRSEAFDAPWRDVARPVFVSLPPTEEVFRGRLEVDAELASMVLGHLLQSIVDDLPLILALPVEAFSGGSKIHRTIGLARAGLPAHLKRHCRIRIYSSRPGPFMAQGRSLLIVIPESSTALALQSAPRATVIGADGRFKAGVSLRPATEEYGRRVVEEALAHPEGLIQFSRRFGDMLSSKRLPTLAESRSVPIIYRLGQAASESEKDRGELLRTYLFKKASEVEDLPWDQLLSQDDWEAFPRDSIVDILLMPSRDLEPCARRLRAAAERACGEMGANIDDQLDDWWDTDEPDIQRLLELLTLDPPLVSPETGVRLLEPTSLATMRQSEGPLHGLLLAELNAKTIDTRADQIEADEALPEDDKAFDVLQRASAEGLLSCRWLERYLDRLAMAPDNSAIELAIRKPGWGSWNKPSDILLDRIIAAGRTPEGRDRIMRLVAETSPLKNVSDFIRLAEAASRTVGLEEQEAKVRSLASRLFQELNRFHAGGGPPKAGRRVVEEATSGRWRWLTPRTLLDEGALKADWIRGALDLVLRNEELRGELQIADLLRLGAGVATGERRGLEAIYGEITRRMAQDQVNTTYDLILERAWYQWRMQLPPDDGRRRKFSMAWLGSPAWSGKVVAESTMECWAQVVEDLRDSRLSGEEMRGLKNSWLPRKLGPAIPPFETRELLDLASLAGDLGAAMELAASAEPEVPRREVEQAALQGLGLVGRLSVDALLWLRPPEARSGRRPPKLSLEESRLLCDNAGHFSGLALESRSGAILSLFEENVAAALQVADREALWEDEGFHLSLARWLARHGSLDSSLRLVAETMDAKLGGAKPAGGDLKCARLIQELAKAGLRNLARLLSPFDLGGDREQVLKRVLDGLMSGEVPSGEWNELKRWAEAIEQNNEEKVHHPLCQLAAVVEKERQLGDIGGSGDAVRAWDTFLMKASRDQARWWWIGQKGSPSVLPAFRLGIALLGPGGAGTVARGILLRARPDLRLKERWWDELLRGVLVSPEQPSPDPVEKRAAAALTLVTQAALHLASDERRAFRKSMDSMIKRASGSVEV